MERQTRNPIPREVRAVKIRDAALAIIRKRGKWEEISNAQCTVKFNAQTVSIDGFNIYYTTPFSKVPGPTGRLIATAAAYGHRIPTDPPYRLTVAQVSPGKGSLSLGWDDNGSLEILAFKSGEWESRFIGLEAA